MGIKIIRTPEPEDEGRPYNYTPPSDSTLTLAEAQADLFDSIREGDPARCPCCEQDAKYYPRSIRDFMARRLLAFAREFGTSWFDKMDYLNSLRPKQPPREESILRFWDLYVPKDGKTFGGMWRVTEKGMAFVQGEVSIPKYAVLYNNTLVRLEGEHVTFADCLKEPLDVDDMLSRRWDENEGWA